MTDDESETVADGVLIIVSLVLAIPMMIWGAWVGSVLWKWFVAGRLGLPALSLAQFMGFALVIQLLTHQRQPRESGKTYAHLIRAIVHDALAPTFALVIGAVIRGCGG